MKRITIVLCLLIHFVYGQENKYLDSLLKAKSNFKLKINTLNDSIKNIDLAIATYKSKQLLKNISDSLITSTCKGNAKLKSNPTVTADIISIIKDGTRIIILDYIDNYFGVCTDSVCGYLNEMWVNKNEKIYDYMRLKEKEEAERDKLIEERKLL